MITRTRILPKTTSDILSVAFLLVIVPLIYWFELFVVLPELFDYGSISYLFHFCTGTFVMLNIIGNFTYTVLCDTSIQSLILPTSRAKIKDGWRLCPTCEAVAPPRSWHCDICGVCILKRDHHCIFTGCCIGHYNHRYFLMFLFYMFIATVYAFFYNNYFIWSKIHFEFPMSIVKIIFPLAIFVFGFDGSVEQFYLLLYIVTCIGMLFTGALCLYHVQLVLYGCTSNEKNKRNYSFNAGWKENARHVLGDQWLLACLLPYTQSKLPHDGISWHVSDNRNCAIGKAK